MECISLREKIKSLNPPITFILYFEITQNNNHLNQELWSHNISDLIQTTEIKIFDTTYKNIFCTTLKEREYLLDFKHPTHFMYTTQKLNDLEMSLYITKLEHEINKLLKSSFIVTFLVSKPFVY
jgi:hypothetical protein